MDKAVGSWEWLVLIMGIWTIACWGLGAGAVFFKSENADQFEE